MLQTLTNVWCQNLVYDRKDILQHFKHISQGKLREKIIGMTIRFVIPIAFTKISWSVRYICLKQLYVGGDMYNLLHND